MHIFDQVAMRSADINADIDMFKAQGHHDWVQDVVEAEHILVHPKYKDRLGERFHVQLAFNYSLVPGTEFELIELIDGMSVQLLTDDRISHFGFHTARDQRDDGTVDSLLEELQRMKSFGCEVLQISQTVSHLNTHKRYRYAFINGGMAGDVPVKIIQRIIPIKNSKIAKSLQEGRELFASCLTQ